MADSEDTISVPHNFRTVCSMMDAKTHQSKGLLYRSSKLDYMMLRDIHDLKNVLGIKSIIDLRSKEEYTHSHNCNFVDQCFTLLNVRVPQTLKRPQAGEKIETEVLQENRSCVEKHYLINFFPRPYVMTLLSRAPWYVRLYCIFWLLMDKVLRSSYLHFMQCFARYILSKRGLIETYTDAIELSQRSIYSVCYNFVRRTLIYKELE
ncbi:hypothetical protein CHS0354_007598 [Potamilus streckersoni]|uniref:Uncharacterized protein n=1 Tax=Potamilus streckersoni TaxID=2493646 RepID=A0AAE0T3Q9_9BIVA|nr:hypothetical protein CHS0354_007598 [Potamilus streckersoni]